ncbi:uncharacterized protein HMPREF1541_01583 [Cyphellophora europaea CBS 101466]|uniref:Short-chain dehydrogenase/reductase SDR n=1 Tax=Cyphellophora europaea (strain CBS 101466) TaxID=1220924 RepID=W2S328_CYPE1|nr:uncharacterized protein HMPREF1541_01583 [Cyphellophora europaea CBS 101466]ETN42428.1 hypothetical protein HMPREF1541_01583 [Cyphellophora europaea CBS 101466]
MLWLVTGCSSGLGLSLANAILDAGHQCIASSRNPSKTPEIVSNFEKKGGKWITLDISKPDVEEVIAKAVADHGAIDVLVNNAGYPVVGPLENQPLKDARDLFETNFFGYIRTIQAVAPSMRERKSGTVVNIGSSEAWQTNPLLSIYSASKWALEGLTETMAAELGVFGIRTLIVEPDAIRTEFANLESQDVPGFLTRMEAYKGTFIEHVSQFLMTMHGTQAIDAAKAAKAIVAEVTTPSSDPPLLRLPLGKESTKKLKAKAEMYASIATATEGVAASVDFDA